MIPRLAILASAILLSTGGAAIKSTTLGAVEVASLRSAIAAVVLLLVTRAHRGPWTVPVFSVGAAMAATMVMFVAANKLTTAANTIFLQSTAPLYVMLVSPRLLGESPRVRDLLHMLALGAGLSLFFLDAQAPSVTAPRPLLGNFIAVASGVTWAATIVGMRALASRTGVARATIAPTAEPTAAAPTAPTAGATTVPAPGRPKGSANGPTTAPTAAPALVVGNALAFLVGLPWLLDDPAALAEGWKVVAYLGIFQVALAYILLDAGVRHVPAVEASLLLLIEPALNPLWAWLVHAETPNAWAATGGAVILSSTALKTVADALARPSSRAMAA